MEPLVTRARIERTIRLAGERQCLVQFINQQGEKREIKFRPSDHFELRDVNNRNYFIVKSIGDDEDYRTINLDTTLRVKHSGKTKRFRAAK